MDFKRLMAIVLTSLFLIVSIVIPVHAANKIIIDIKYGEHDQDYGNRELKVWKISDEKLTGDLTEKLKEFEKFSIEELDGKFEENFITSKSDEKGQIILSDISNGTYYVREINRENYTLVPFFILVPMKENVIYPKVDIKVPSTEPTKPTEPTKETEPSKPSEPSEPTETGRYHFIKVDEDGKTPLKEAVFKVNIKKGDYYYDYMVDGKPYIVKSDKNGKFVVENLPYGTYYLKEIVPPKGYKALSESIKFEVSDESGQYELVIKNKREDINVPPGRNEKPRNKIRVPKTGDITLIVMVISGAMLFYIGKKLIRE